MRVRDVLVDDCALRCYRKMLYEVRCELQAAPDALKWTKRPIKGLDLIYEYLRRSSLILSSGTTVTFIWGQKRREMIKGS